MVANYLQSSRSLTLSEGTVGMCVCCGQGSGRPHSWPFPLRWANSDEMKCKQKQRPRASLCPPPKSPPCFPTSSSRLNETFRITPVHIALKLSPRPAESPPSSKQAPRWQHRQALCWAHHPSRPPGKKPFRGKMEPGIWGMF